MYTFYVVFPMNLKAYVRLRHDQHDYLVLVAQGSGLGIFCNQLWQSVFAYFQTLSVEISDLTSHQNLLINI